MFLRCCSVWSPCGVLTVLVQIKFLAKMKLIFSLIAGILDFILNFPGYHRCKFIDVMRNILKIIVSAAWAVILPFFYISTAAKVKLPLKDLEKWFHYVKGVPPLYIMAVAVYLIPNIISAALFLFPMSLKQYLRIKCVQDSIDWLKPRSRASPSFYMILLIMRSTKPEIGE